MRTSSHSSEAKPNDKETTIKEKSGEFHGPASHCCCSLAARSQHRTSRRRNRAHHSEYDRASSRSAESLVEPGLYLSRLIKKIGIRKLNRQGFGRRILEKI